MEMTFPITLTWKVVLSSVIVATMPLNDVFLLPNYLIVSTKKNLFDSLLFVRQLVDCNRLFSFSPSAHVS